VTGKDGSEETMRMRERKSWGIMNGIKMSNVKKSVGCCGGRQGEGGRGGGLAGSDG